MLLWQRDELVCREVRRWPLLNRQLRILAGFSTAKKTSERCHQLYGAGIVNRVPSLQANRQGNAEYLYYLSRRRPEPMLHAHTIAVGDLRVSVHEVLKRLPDFASEFYYGHELPIMPGLGLVPDAGLLLERNGKALLTFFEVDLGTESVASSSRYSLSRKFCAYAAYFDAQGAERDFSFWPGALRGFRVAVVVPSGRLPQVLHLVRASQHDFVILTTFDLLKDGLHRPVWLAHDGRTVDFLGRAHGDMKGE